MVALVVVAFSEVVDAPGVVAALSLPPMLEPMVVAEEPVGIGVLLPLLAPVAGVLLVPVAGALPGGVPDGWLCIVWPVAGIWFWFCVGAELVCAQTNDVLINKNAALAPAMPIAFMLSPPVCTCLTRVGWKRCESSSALRFLGSRGERIAPGARNVSVFLASLSCSAALLFPPRPSREIGQRRPAGRLTTQVG